MNTSRRPEADPTRLLRLLKKAFIPALLAALLVAAGAALLRLTPAAAAAAQSDPAAPELIWMNGGHAGGSGALAGRAGARDG